MILNKALELLQPVKDNFGDGLSWADLIVLSATTALEQANPDISVPFKGGRVDALYDEDPYPEYLENRLSGGGQGDNIDTVKDVMLVWGLTPREIVALIGAGHSLGRMHQDRSGFPNGTWTENPDVLNNEFFGNLKNLNWAEQWSDSNLIHYNTTSANGVPLQMLRTDMNLIFDAEFRAIVEEYATNTDIFFAEFLSAWEKIMTADMFGYASIVVDEESSSDDDDSELSSDTVVAISIIGGAVGGAILMGAAGYLTGGFGAYEKKGVTESLLDHVTN